MIAEGIDKILTLRDPEKIEVNSEYYTKRGYQKAYPSVADTLHLNSLTGLVDYIKENIDRHAINLDLMVHVLSYNTVDVISCVDTIYRTRERYIQASYIRPGMYAGYDDYMKIEEFRIWLMTDFIDNADRKAILRLIGNITDQQVKTSTDDGISQAVSSRVGIAKVETAMVPNPVNLVPFRTFPEVEQPASNFVLRLQSGIREDDLPKAALFEADGGAWKNAALLNIRDWLKSELPNDVTILA